MQYLGPPEDITEIPVELWGRAVVWIVYARADGSKQRGSPHCAASCSLVPFGGGMEAHPELDTHVVLDIAGMYLMRVAWSVRLMTRTEQEQQENASATTKSVRISILVLIACLRRC
jgi:hypothetical protein